MKLWKKGLFLLAFGLILLGGVTQTNAATKEKSITSYSGSTVTVKDSYDYLQIRATTKTLKINAPKTKEIFVYDWDGKCTSVDLTKCTSTKSVGLAITKLSSFKVPKNGGSIKKIRLSTNAKKLSIPTLKKATYLSIYESGNLTSVNFKNVPNLQKLVLLDDSKLSKVDISKNSKLKTLAFADTAIKSVDTSHNPNLKLFSAGYNSSLKSIDVTKNTKLTALQCYDNKVTTLKVGEKNTKLKEVNCENNKLTTLNLSKAKNINTVTCYNNPLKTLSVNSTKNILDTVSKTSEFDNVTGTGGTVTVTMKKSSDIKNYKVFVDADYYTTESYKNEGLTYMFRSYNFSLGESYKVWAVSGVSCNKATIYYKDTYYDNSVTVSN